MALSSNSCAAQSPIGIFDSGVGGISVLRHIREQLPNESLCYFGDCGFVPYGDKSESEIIERTLLIANHLYQRGVKAIVIACNTATTAAIKLVRAKHPELILVGVEPGIKPASSLTKTGCVGILATSRTIGSARYQLLCERIHQIKQIRFIHQACPGLVPQIELGELDSDATLNLLRNFLRPMFTQHVDTLVLGSTHFPFLAGSIQRIIDEESPIPVQLIDTGAAVTRHLKRLLEERQLINQQNIIPPLQCITSGDVEQFQSALQRLLHLDASSYHIQSFTQ